MPKQRHDTKTHLTTGPAENDHHGSGCCSSQQAAAAWAWLQHGGGTCITPRRAEGLLAANLMSANCMTSRPSRFKLELKQNTAINPDQHSKALAEDAAAKGQAKRRHSFHDTPARRPTVGSFSSHSTSTTTADCATWLAQQLVAADHGHDVIKGYNVHEDDEASSLLDKFELEAVCKQLVGIGAPNPKAEQLGCAAKAQNAVNPPTVQLQLNQRHVYRSEDDLSAQKSSAGGLWRGLTARFHHHHHHHHRDDHPHGHQFGHGAADLLHHLLDFRIMTSVRSPAPFCSSIATVNSIAHHHQSVSAKKFRASHVQEPLQYDGDTTEKIGRFSSKHSGAKLNRPSQGNLTVFEPADEEIAADQHGKLQQMQQHAAPAGRHSHSKVLQSLIHRLPHMNSQISHESPSKATGTNHRHFHNHHHFHHHYHHHHLQRHAADAALVDHLHGSDASAAVCDHRRQYCLQNGSTQYAGRPLHYIAENGRGLHAAEG